MKLTLLSFLFFTVLVGVVSWYFTRKEKLDTQSGYFLGGRSLTATVIAGSMLLTNLSTEQLVGLNAQAYSSGLSVLAWEAAASTAIIIMALFFLPKYLQGAITTVPEFLESRYDKSTRNIVSILFLISLGLIFLPTVLYSGSIALMKLFNVSELFGISENSALILMIWAIGIIGSFYAIFGGLKAVAVSDTLNGIGLIIGGVLIPIIGLKMIGNGSVVNGFSSLITDLPEKMNTIGGPKSKAPFGGVITGMRITALYYWCTNQAIIQRALGAKNLKEGQKGVILTAFLKIVLAPFITVIPGIIAIKLIGPDITGDLVYPSVVAKVLPTYLTGFFGAVLFGAILSSFNSALNSASTIFALNVYKPVFNSKIKDKDLVKVSKIFGTILAILAMLCAPMIAKSSGGLFEYLKKATGLFNVPIATIVLIGIFSKKATALGAKISMAFFVIIYGLTQFVFKTNIHFLYMIAILFVLSLIIIMIIAKVKPREEDFVFQIKKSVDTTYWEYSYTASSLTMLLLVWVYLIFSKAGILFYGDAMKERFRIITGIFVLIGIVITYFTRRYEKKNISVSQSPKLETCADKVE